MRSRYKEIGKKVPQAYLRYVEDTFLPCDAVDALRFAKASDVINYTNNTHVITDYQYDSFGRRIHTAERTKSGMRTIYDGLSFEVVKEAETFLGTRGITSSATGEANFTNYTPHGSDHTRGTRQYFIRDRGQELRTDKNGEALPDRIKGVRTYLYLNGERVAVNNLYNTNHGQYYYGSDLLGSVKFITGQAGQEVRRIEYDVFGGIYKGNSPYGLETGYTGKPYDAVTGFIDYGFRDYSPTQARFITEDPIRDGENWFAYVGNNPVNWIDPWGLSASEKRNSNNSLQQNKHYENGLSKTFSSINEYIKELPAIIKDKIWNSVTEFHFEKRDALNKNLPTYEEALRDKNWTLLRPELSIYHDNGFGHSEKKFVNRDGREAVYTQDFSSDGSYQLYTDQKYKGTYNYVTPSSVPKDWKDVKRTFEFVRTGTGHLIMDVLPYYLTGKKNERYE